MGLTSIEIGASDVGKLTSVEAEQDRKSNAQPEVPLKRGFGKEQMTMTPSPRYGSRPTTRSPAAARDANRKPTESPASHPADTPQTLRAVPPPSPHTRAHPGEESPTATPHSPAASQNRRSWSDAASSAANSMYREIPASVSRSRGSYPLRQNRYVICEESPRAGSGSDRRCRCAHCSHSEPIRPAGECARTPDVRWASRTSASRVPPQSGQRMHPATWSPLRCPRQPREKAHAPPARGMPPASRRSARPPARDARLRERSPPASPCPHPHPQPQRPPAARHAHEETERCRAESVDDTPGTPARAPKISLCVIELYVIDRGPNCVLRQRSAWLPCPPMCRPFRGRLESSADAEWARSASWSPAPSPPTW